MIVIGSHVMQPGKKSFLYDLKVMINIGWVNFEMLNMFLTEATGGYFVPQAETRKIFS
jgi:hypothetical protein